MNYISLSVTYFTIVQEKDNYITELQKKDEIITTLQSNQQSKCTCVHYVHVCI